MQENATIVAYPKYSRLGWGDYSLWEETSVKNMMYSFFPFLDGKSHDP